MSMHRLLVDSQLLREDCPVLPKDAARHLKVLRPEDGEKVELFDGLGNFRVYAWHGELKAESQTLFADRDVRELTLFACVTKGSRWDWTIEKATELGVTRIVPVISERTIVRIPKDERHQKRERWLRIAEDAARQSDSKWLPEILEAVDFKDALPLVKQTQCLIGALTDPPSSPIGEKRGNAVFIGPEGDFTADELSQLMAIATPVSFGATILRAETAAIFALSVLRAMPPYGSLA